MVLTGTPLTLVGSIDQKHWLHIRYMYNWQRSVYLACAKGQWKGVNYVSELVVYSMIFHYVVLIIFLLNEADVCIFASVSWVSLGSDNDSLPVRHQPNTFWFIVHIPLAIHCSEICRKIQHRRKWIWNWRLKNGGDFVSVSICWLIMA